MIPAEVRTIDAMLCRLAAARDLLVLPLARAAGLLHRASGWAPFGFTHLDAFARERLDRSGSWLRRLAALDRAVEAHPALGVALSGADGGPPLGTSAALLISGVAHLPAPGSRDAAAATAPPDTMPPATAPPATASPDTVPPDTVRAWIALARTLRFADLQHVVRSASAAEAIAPDDAPSGIRLFALSSAAGAPSERASAPSLADAAANNEPQLNVRLMAPPDVLEAFEQTLELHRAVVGRECGAVSFVESLCAEAASGAFPHDVPAVPIQRRVRAASQEDRFGAPPPPLDAPAAGVSLHTSAMRRASALLRRLDAISRDLEPRDRGPATLPRLRRAASQLVVLVRMETAIELRIGELLAELDAQRPWKLLRFSGLTHYAEERLRMNRTTASDRVAASRGLRRLPVVETAYERGQIGLEKALLILRLHRSVPLDASGQHRWVCRARQATLKRCRDESRALRREIAMRRSDPAAAASSSAGVTLHVGDGFAIRGAGRAHALGIAAHPLDDAAWLRSVHRAPGTARAFVLDVGCRILDRESASRPAPVVCKNVRLPEDIGRTFAAAIHAARQTLIDAAAHLDAMPPADAARARPSTRIVRLFAGKPEGVPAWVGLLALLEEYVLTWDAPEGMPDRRHDAIHRRDGYRCMAPGCTRRQNLEVHHLEYRSHGGGNGPENLVTLCSAHHRQGEHGTFASCAGTAPLDVVWGLGHPEFRTWYRNELRVDVAPLDQPLESTSQAAG